MDLDHLRLIGRVFYYGICFIAVLRGDRPLRFASVAIIINSLITPVAQWGHVRGEPYYGEMAVDLALLAALSVILVRDRRWWLVTATGFFLMSLLTHLAPWIGTPISSYVTSTVRVLWCYAMVLAVGLGLVQHERLKRRGGREDIVRALIAEQGEARTRAELDRRHLVASTPAERAEAARLMETLRQLTQAHRYDPVG